MPRSNKRPVELGDLVRDRITSFEGIVIGYTYWLSGCDRVVVQPRKLDDRGHKPMTESFDVTEVEVVERGVIQPQHKTENSAEAPGGPRPTPTRW